MYAEQQSYAGIASGLVNRAIGGGISAGNTVASKATEVSSSLETLAKNIDRLGDAVYSLRERLSPALSPEAPQDCANSPAALRTSPLGNAIFEANERLYRLGAALDDLRARVQL